MTVFIQKGDAPLSKREAEERGARIFTSQMIQWQREQGIVESDPDYLSWAADWVADNQVNAANNLFNHQLAGYRKHKAVLDTPFDDGSREAYVSEEIIGYRGLEAEPIYREYEAVPAIPMTVTVSQTDPETGEAEEVEVEHPVRKADREAREFAQVVVALTPQAVIDWGSQ